MRTKKKFVVHKGGGSRFIGTAVRSAPLDTHLHSSLEVFVVADRKIRIVTLLLYDELSRLVEGEHIVETQELVRLPVFGGSI